MKKAIVTGASGDLGKAIIRKLLFHNYEIYGVARSSHVPLDADLKKIHWIICDLSDHELIQKNIGKIANEIDIFIHCVSLPLKTELFIDKNWSSYLNHIELQAGSFFEILKLIVPGMKERRFGRIVCVLTELTLGKPSERLSDYVTGKYALLGLAKSAAAELSKYNILVNAVSPGLMQTKLTSEFPAKLFEITKNRMPNKKLTEVSDVADVILNLCQENSSSFGENIHILN